MDHQTLEMISNYAHSQAWMSGLCEGGSEQRMRKGRSQHLTVGPQEPRAHYPTVGPQEPRLITLQ